MTAAEVERIVEALRHPERYVYRSRYPGDPGTMTRKPQAQIDAERRFEEWAAEWRAEGCPDEMGG